MGVQDRAASFVLAPPYIRRFVYVGLPFLFTLMSAVSCGPRFDYNGTWIGYRELKPGANEDPSAIRSISKVELTLKPDGTFELFQTGIPKSGNVAYGDGGARLDVRFIAQRSLSTMDPETAKRNQSLMIKPLENGSLEFLDPGDFDPRPIELIRKPKP